MKRIDLQIVMSWHPCKDFPRDKIAAMLEGVEGSLADVFAADMRHDEHLWVALREVFFSAEELEKMAGKFVLHVGGLAYYKDPAVTGALMNAIFASTKQFGMLPQDPRQDRWKEGATEAEKCAALSALWAAIARAATQQDKISRKEQWIFEREWQESLVKETAQSGGI